MSIHKPKFNMPVTGDHSGRMNLIPHKLVGPPQEFRGEENDRSGTVTDFLVLLSCKRNKNPSLNNSISRALQEVNGGADSGMGNF